jgi:steroid delta-isomerase-like uncharacterized protein
VTAAENESTARRLVDVCINRVAPDRLGEFVAPSVVVHAATPGEAAVAVGLEELAGVLRCTRGAFPDLHVTVEDTVARGDRVVLRWTARGTHDAEWAGIPATGRRVTYGGIDLYRFEAGRIREWWRNDDFAYLVQQLE